MPALAALIDWDGTIRRGFTIVQWFEYLRETGTVPESAVTKLEFLFTTYADGGMPHDELARRTAKLYATSISGCREADIVEQACRFHLRDQHMLIPESVRLLTYLRDHRITLISISGSPIETLRLFVDDCGLERIYGLQCEVKRGKYSGNILFNPGDATTKQEIVAGLVETGRYHIIAAVGNSRSDVPLFRRAEVAMVVDNPTLSIAGKRVVHIDSKVTFDDALNFLSEVIQRYE